MSAFTARHYAAIATAIREEVNTATAEEDHASVMSLARTVQRLAALFAGDNPAFDRRRFTTACGFDSEEVAEGE